MTVLEKFLQFAERLPAERPSSVEAALAEIMASHSERHDFSTAELATLDQRVAEE